MCAIWALAGWRMGLVLELMLLLHLSWPLWCGAPDTYAYDIYISTPVGEATTINLPRVIGPNGDYLDAKVDTGSLRFGAVTKQMDFVYLYKADPAKVDPAGATDTFTYTLFDAQGITSTANVVITLGKFTVAEHA